MTTLRRTVCWSFALLLALTFLSSTDAARAQVASDATLPIIVALEPFAPMEADAPEWLSLLVREIESSETRSPVAIQVSSAVMLENELLRVPRSSDSKVELQELALLTGARYIVIGRVTRLTSSYSLDVRVLDAERLQSLAHLVYEGQGQNGLAAAIAEAARGVRSLVSRPLPPVESAPRQVWARPDFGPEAESVLSGGPTQVLEIDVRGNRRIEADAIRAVVGTRVGEPLRQDRIGEDVRRIYGLGFFRNVQVESIVAPGGVVVTFVVEENPIIRQVSVSGNDNIGSDDIKDQLTLTIGSTIDYPLLLENQARVDALYKTRGFYLVKVGYSVEPLGEDSVAINYDITEGKKLRLVAVDFEGNEALSDKTLRSVLQTKPWGWKSYVSHFWDHSGIYAEPIFYQDLERISRKYMDEGFIRARIDDPEVTVDKKGLTVTVSVNEGPQYKVGNVDVIGDESMDRDELWAYVELGEGNVFSRATLTADVERLRAHYADRGFFSAKVTPRTRVDDERRAVDTAFEVEKGGLYFVDRIDIHGNTRTRDPVVRREVGLVEGQLYSAEALRRSQARVRRLGFFEEVSVETKPLDEPGRVAVDVDVVERPTGSFSFGAGVGSADGLILNASIRQDNLFGKAYGLQASIDFGSSNSNMFIRFTNPHFMNSMTSMSTSFARSETEFTDFDQESLGLTLNLSYPLDESDTRVGAGYSYSQRDITGFGDFQAASMLQREEFEDTTDTSLLMFSMARDTRDDIRFPREGRVTGLGVEFAGLGGLNTFLRLEGRTTWYMPAKRFLGFDSTFIINSRIGWAIPFNDISDFDLPGCTDNSTVGASCQDLLGLAGNPANTQALTNIDDDLKLNLSERYFLGGLGSFQVRGFEQRSLGPRRSILTQSGALANGTNDRFFWPSGRNAAGDCEEPSGKCNNLGDTDDDDFADLDLTDTIGGNKMFLLNLELQFPISEALGLRGIAFLDMGNAFAENDGINPADLRFGAGGGVQWFSPFGPIMLILGIPLDPLDDEEGSVFEFSFGGSQF